MAPKGTVALLAVAALAAALAYWGGWRRPALHFGLLAVLALLLLWFALASLWSFETGGALMLTLRVAALLAAGMVLFVTAAGLSEAARARAGDWLVTGFILALVFMIMEAALDFPLLRIFKEAGGADGTVWLNRSAVAMALLVWPVTAHLWKRRLGWKALALPLLLGAATVFMESAAATLGMAAGLAAALLLLCLPAAGRAVCLGATVLLFVGMPFAAREMHEGGWHRAEWLFGSARHRVEIWNFSVDRIAERPFLGWGFDSARHMGEAHPGFGGSNWEIMPLHPHNAPLQILLELGSVGYALALALLCMAAFWLNRFPRPTRTFGQALFIALLAVSCVAFGLWQNWWLALILSAALLMPLTDTRTTPPARGGAHRPGS